STCLPGAIEEQERHHLARVGQAQLVRTFQMHGTLYRVQIEMQKSSQPDVDDERLAVGSLKQTFLNGLAIAAGCFRRRNMQCSSGNGLSIASSGGVRPLTVASRMRRTGSCPERDA